MENKYALISVSNKDNIEDISFFLLNNGYTLLSTGGTYQKLIDSCSDQTNKDKIIKVSDITSFPEILNGRVKTLHPKIAGGILAQRSNSSHMEELEKHQIPKIDVVIVNLYPFREVTSKPECSLTNAIENIDIGGHTLIRESAKNYQDILILVDPNDYTQIISNFNSIEINDRFKYAKKAFHHATNYDIWISNYFNNLDNDFNNVFRSYTCVNNFKYGCNPHQNNANLYTLDEESPITIINGNLGYINMIDALHSWQLVKELSSSLNTCAAASFKHTSPAGVGTSTPLSENLKKIYDVENIELSDLAIAFIRARYTDPMSSFGDFIALSHPVDESTAKLIKREISDGVIAPSYSEEALKILRSKKGGKYLILQINPNYQNQSKVEFKEIFGMALSQEPNKYQTNINSLLDIKTKNNVLTSDAITDLIIANISLKYAQSNNVSYAYNGQLAGLAAGQQNRVDCVKLAGEKAKTWCLLQHPKILQLKSNFKSSVKRQDKINAYIKYIRDDFSELEYKSWLNLFENTPEKLSTKEKDNFLKNNFQELSMASDAFFPFRDNIDYASKYGVKYILQPGGSMADESVIQACNEYNMVMSFSGKRMFYH